MVPTTGLEPVRCYPLEPESSASANSATWALSSNRTMFALRRFFCQSKAVQRSASSISRPFALASTLLALVNIWAHHSSANVLSASARFEDPARRLARSAGTLAGEKFHEQLAGKGAGAPGFMGRNCIPSARFTGGVFATRQPLPLRGPA